MVDAGPGADQARRFQVWQLCVYDSVLEVVWPVAGGGQAVSGCLNDFWCGCFRTDVGALRVRVGVGFPSQAAAFDAVVSLEEFRAGVQAGFFKANRRARLVAWRDREPGSRWARSPDHLEVYVVVEPRVV